MKRFVFKADTNFARVILSTSFWTRKKKKREAVVEARKKEIGFEC